MPETGQHKVEMTTPRLRLRRLRRADAALIALHCSDAKVARMTGSIPHPYPPGAAEAFVERALSPAATQSVWAIDAGEDGENGLIGVVSMRTHDDEVEIGYWVASAFWGTGHASEAVDAVVACAAAMKRTALTAQVFQDNPAAARVLTRAGFVYEGAGEVHSVARGGMVPTFRYRHNIGSR